MYPMDNVTIGLLFTEKVLEKGGPLYFNLINKLYEFVWRPDLNAQSVGVINDGVTDTSNVYEVIAPTKDLTVKANVTIEAEHREIHAGNHFFQSNYVSIPALGTLTIVIETATKRPHLIFNMNTADGGFTFITYENVVANADGTLLPILNNNRTHSNGNTVTIRQNPTGLDITGAIVVRSGIAGNDAAGTNRVVGNIVRGNELIFKPNTKYALVITNISNVILRLNLSHEWYEK